MANLFIQEAICIIVMAIIAIPTILIIKRINAKGEAGLIPFSQKFNLMTKLGIIFFFIPPIGFILTIPMLLIGRAQMRWNMERGYKASTWILVLGIGVLFLGALGQVASQSTIPM